MPDIQERRVMTLAYLPLDVMFHIAGQITNGDRLGGSSAGEYSRVSVGHITGVSVFCIQNERNMGVALSVSGMDRMRLLFYFVVCLPGASAKVLDLEPFAYFLGMFLFFSGTVLNICQSF
ncbi:hypothetical protein L0665_06320 [Methanogenium marinum]|uniref:Uncharacterized protein n=1 Tax=Methanogenium marinum TaxID=348610 RepID=A0A9Q4KPK9_9EURY|nr:hypothetical protein [Methanogenium marinum]MDE4908223.1 hypothetical protein [Methanogenium marinum]